MGTEAREEVWDVSKDPAPSSTASECEGLTLKWISRGAGGGQGDQAACCGRFPTAAAMPWPEPSWKAGTHEMPAWEALRDLCSWYMGEKLGSGRRGPGPRAPGQLSFHLGSGPWVVCPATVLFSMCIGALTPPTAATLFPSLGV